MKNILSIFIASLVALGASAQNLNLGLGLSYEHGKPNVLGEHYQSDGSEEFTRSVICGSLATGFGAQLDVGYDICEHGEIKLDLSYLYGANTNVEESMNEFSGGSYIFTESQQYSRLDLRPGIRIKTNNETAWNYYGEVGVIIPVWNNTVITTESENPFSDNNTQVWHRNDRLVIGGDFGVGAQYQLNDNLSIFGEVGANVITGKTKTSELFSETLDGEEQDLSEYDTYNIQTNYLMELNQDSNNFGFNDSADLDLPRETLEFSNNYASGFLMVGARLNF